MGIPCECPPELVSHKSQSILSSLAFDPELGRAKALFWASVEKFEAVRFVELLDQVLKFQLCWLVISPKDGRVDGILPSKVFFLVLWKL